jgi:aspartate racemase
MQFMKTIGIIGGLSWYSTSVYYSTINQLTNQQLGGSHSARILLYSVNFVDFKTLQEKDDWNGIGRMLSDFARRLQTAGADCILIASNTPHLVADTVRHNIQIPLLHIAEETAKVITRQNIAKVGLLGTKFTMENDFFKNPLATLGIQTIIPEIVDRESIHNAIFNELTKGIFNDGTKRKFLQIIEKLKMEGAEGIIFGCTEIALLIKPVECSIPVFDTTLIHSNAAVKFALDN